MFMRSLGSIYCGKVGNIERMLLYILSLDQRSGNAQVVVGYQGDTQSYIDY